jgi:hypothetical protein
MLQAASAPLHASPGDEDGPMSDEPARRPPPPHRAGKTLAGGYIDKTDHFIVQELCLRLSREAGKRVTMQDFFVQAITHECERHNVKLTGKS